MMGWPAWNRITKRLFLAKESSISRLVLAIPSLMSPTLSLLLPAIRALMFPETDLARVSNFVLTFSLCFAFIVRSTEIFLLAFPGFLGFPRGYWRRAWVLHLGRYQSCSSHASLHVLPVNQLLFNFIFYFCSIISGECPAIPSEVCGGGAKAGDFQNALKMTEFAKQLTLLHCLSSP